MNSPDLTSEPEGCLEIIAIGALRIARISVRGGQVVKVLEPADLDSDYALGYLPVVVHSSDADATAEMVERIVTAGFHLDLPVAEIRKHPTLVGPLRDALHKRAESIKQAIYWMEQPPRHPVQAATRQAMARCRDLCDALTSYDMETTP